MNQENQAALAAVSDEGMTVKKESSLLLPSTLRMVAWEITRSCNLSCRHCRASALHGPYPGELSTQKCMQVLDEIASVGNPVVILTGGEPLLRDDVYDLASYGDSKGLRMVLATNGTLLTGAIAERLIKSGIKRVSVSIDGADAASHDDFRGVQGAFAGTMSGIEAMKQAGMEFQINTTITKGNLAQISRIHDLAHTVGAAAHHIFLLVPTGRGKEMADQEIAPVQYEETLNWFFDTGLGCSMQLKATCAPHYYRIFHQRHKELEQAKGESAAARSRDVRTLHSMTRGCMGGSSFCFISHTGQVQPCGYLELDCGQLKTQSFVDVWKNSPVFQNLRDLSRYKGKCGRCEFLKVCGGCRARAYEATGDYLAEEPYCIYEPGGGKKSK